MIEEIKKELGSFIDVSSHLELDKLPNYIKKSIQFLSGSSDVPLETLLMILNVKIAQMLSYNRIKFRGNEDTEIIGNVLMNIYGINFLHSGGGKDKTLEAIDEYFLGFFQSEFDANNKQYIDKAEEFIRKEAEEKFGGSKAEQTRYIKEHLPRPFNKEIGEATSEGFNVSRETLQKANFGSIFIKLDEISSYLKGMKPENVSFFRGLISSYEGNLAPKVIKSERVSIATKGIPNNVLMYGTVKGLLEGQNRDNFLEFLEIGFARRSFICYPEKPKKVKHDNFDALLNSRRKKRKELANPEIKSEVQAILKNAFQSTEIKIDFDDGFKATTESIFNLYEKKAVRKYLMYQVYCSYRSENTENMLQSIEIRERYWKMIKLATMIACIRHPNDLNISEDDINCAIYQTEFFGNQAGKFFNHEEKTHEEIVYDYIISKGEVLKTEIRDDLKLINKNKFKVFFEKLMPSLEDLINEKGMRLIERQEGNKHYFSIQNLDVQNIDELKITCSQGINNEASSTIMKPFTIDFDNITKLTAVDKMYSFSQYNEQKRSQTNATGVVNVLALDIDDNIDIKKAQEILKNYRGYITTTRNHQKEKKGLTCDRFRVLIPIVEHKFNNKEFKNCLTNFEKNVFGEGMLDSACFELSRAFFGNPNQEVFKLGGDKIIDLKLYYKEEKEYKPLPKQQEGFKADNVIEPGTFIDGKPMEYYEYLKPGETVPIRCINNLHIDKTKSGFIGRSSTSGNLFCKCSGCGMETKWFK